MNEDLGPCCNDTAPASQIASPARRPLLEGVNIPADLRRLPQADIASMHAEARLDATAIAAKVRELDARTASAPPVARARPGGRRAAPQPGAPLRVLLAQPRGFCAGVVRAIEIVERALQKYKAPVYVRHEIVHNKRVVEALKAKGAHFVEDLAEVPDHAVVIFSAHGVPRSVEKAAARRPLAVLDATCPLVTKVHNQGKRHVAQGRRLIFIGHAGHPEVVGAMGQIPGRIALVQNAQDVAALKIPDDAPVAYVTQTTLSVDDTLGIIDALHRRFSNIIGPDTRDICYATQNRQSAARELCRSVDVLLVVGAANSSNSNRLREIGAEMGVPSYLVADADELRPEWILGARSVGVTAGASAPEDLVLDLIERLAQMGPVAISTVGASEEPIEFRLPAELR